jgi:ribosomal protein S13
MRFAIVLTALSVCGSVQGQDSPAINSGDVQKIERLNSEQEKAVDDYIRQNERPTGELRVVADRNRIAVRSSQAIRALFPRYRFVAVTWIYEADPAAFGKYSIPGPLSHTLVLDENGRNLMPNRTGYLAEYAGLLRAERVKVTDDTWATLVRSALTDIYGIGMGSANLRHGSSEWSLGYQELPFRAISSYEEVREASYYLISVDTNGFVIGGRLVTEVLERRKLRGG